TTIYSVRLIATITDSDGNTFMRPITLSVDQSGNPTVPPQGGLGDGRLEGPGGKHGRGSGSPCGSGGGDSSDSDASGSTTTRSKSSKSKASPKTSTTRRFRV
ncbi:MAG: hypothetical protein ACM359_19765, partial [Bacillota bacterium]